MDYFDETMKQIQKATERIGHANFNHTNPWQSLHHMQHIFNQNFWQNVHQLTSLAQAQSAGDPAGSEHSDLETKDETNKFTPKIDLFETLGKIIVCCELAGLDKNSLKISVSNGQLLTIQGKIKEYDLVDYLIQNERYFGKFTRQVNLPSLVLSDGVKTTYRDGLLQVHLTKKSKKQKVKGTKVLPVDLE